MPAYLETQREANVPYYRRFGWELTGEIALDDSPPAVDDVARAAPTARGLKSAAAWRLKRRRPLEADVRGVEDEDLGQGAALLVALADPSVDGAAGRGRDDLRVVSRL